ncbi:tetratricopeptide (TPR) repeat protein [Actinoplanes lutulentus]|uniref:WG repeat-containing protein n=1 Tax=Actinoplanes lutulentus TaxID=1287878 RepID=UPI0016068F63|nr:WG repeat-containing protein [Actinoplanes lutulentus]MBB2941744.1 tetratricopeptide (TPR) repeat protein [Actinoplanes lutulentus]
MSEQGSRPAHEQGGRPGHEQGGRPGHEQQVPRLGLDGRSVPGQVSPAGPAYGSARPAPPEAFPAYADERRTPREGRTPEAPFDLRPVPQDRNAPAPSRPAPQPTRVTPQQPVMPPAAVYPHAQPSPAGPGVPQPHPASGPVRPAAGPGGGGLPVQPGSGPARHGVVPVVPGNGGEGIRPAGSGPIAPVSGPGSAAPVSGPAPISGSGVSFRPEESGDSQNRFHAGEQLRGGSHFQGGEPPRHGDRFPTGAQPRGEERFPGSEQPRREERFPTGEQPQREERFPTGEQVRRDETGRAVDARQADLAGTQEADYEHRQVIDPRRLGTHAAGPDLGTVAGSPAEAVIPPVERRPAAHSRPDEPVAPVRREEPAAPGVPVEPAAAEEPHGLGWLLSMSGLGATTPVPEAEAEPEAEPEVAPEVRPQGWFAPAIESDEEAETDNSALEEPAAGHIVAEELVAQQSIAEEPIAEQFVADEPVLVAEQLDVEEPVVAAERLDVEERVVVEEPVLGEEPGVFDGAVSDGALLAETLTVRSIAQDLPSSELPVEEFVVQQPFGEELVSEEAVDEETVAEEPAVDVAPVVEEPADRLADAVIVDMPVPAAFVADEPVVIRHLAQASLDDEPLAETPVAGGPIPFEPDVTEPEPIEPELTRHEPIRHEAIEHEVVGSEVAGSEVAGSEVAGPDLSEPDTDAANVDVLEADVPQAVDAGAIDAGAIDAGAIDAGAIDAGAIDAGAIDAGAIDAGAIDAGAADVDAAGGSGGEAGFGGGVAVEEPDFDKDFAEFQSFGELTAEEPADGRPGFDQPFADFQSFGGSAPADEVSDEPASEIVTAPVALLEPATEPITTPTTTPVEAAAVETAPVETAPVETAAVEAAAVEAAAVEAAPVEAAVVAASTAETAPAGERAPVAAVRAESPVDAVLESRLSEKGQAASEGSDRPALGVPKREPVRQRRDQRSVGDRRRADPEEILASYAWTFDPETLREQVDEPDRLGDLIDRLTDRLEFAERDNVRAGLLSLRAVVSRVLGDLDEALEDAREAVRHAEASGELRPVSIAQARLAHVLQWRGEFAEADRLYAQADSVELPSRTRAEIFELAGRSAFEQGRFLEAVNHFERALDVRQGGDPELIERAEMALDAITKKTASQSWGPYPRSRDELLGRVTAPMPLLDDGAGLWGFAAAVEPSFAEVRPFAEGAAWVRRPDSPAWELIDPSGNPLINREYLQVQSFAEGLAWVSRQPQGGWFVIDRQNRAVVNGQFEDARPFRRGIALIQQGGVWGAVDRHGRIAVPPGWPAFATTLHIGGDLDGFSDEGLAVVSAGERLGVLDRTGRLVVEPFFEKLVIHPSAFLVSQNGRWGALTRKGEPLVDLVHEDRAAAVEAIEEEARPVL